MNRSTIATCALALLTACGGGEGAWLQIDPPSLTMELYERDPAEFGVTATIVANPPGVSGTIYAGLVDPDGVLRPDWQLIRDGETGFIIYMHISESLTAGRYTGTILFRLCEDDPAVCARPVSGSPWGIGYDFTIREGDHLTPLVKLPGVGPWTTWQGNASHTGAIPATLDVAKFTRRFGHPGKVGAAVIADGLVYVTVEGTEQIDRTVTLLALRESDGGVAWSRSLGSPWHESPPAVGNGQVYVSVGSTFRVFDAATGDDLKTVFTQAQSWPYGAPEVSGTAVFAGSGSMGGVLRFDAETLSTVWSTPFDLLNDNAYTFTVDADHVYGMRHDSNLYLFDAATGAYQSQVAGADDVPATMFYVQETGGLVLGTGGLAFRSYLGSTNDDDWQGRLIGYDLAVPEKKWALSDHFTSAPALADGVLYVVNGTHLDARDPATGALRWRWTPDGGLIVVNGSLSHVVVAGNIAFVSDSFHTYGVDLTTRRTVWAYPGAGPLAISDHGVLYISARTGTLAAVNLH